MKQILCFGDSNTFGFNPKNGLRFSSDVRWTGILQKLCGDNFKIIEAGCNNRTCFRNNPEGKKFTGLQILPEYLAEKFDVVILCIGTNDLQRQYNTSLEELQYGLESLVKLVKNKSFDTEIIVVSPPLIGEEVLKSRIFSFLFDETSIEKSKHLAEIYSHIAKIEGCKFLDLAKLVIASPLDGLHLDEVSHKLVAEAVYQIIISN